MQKHKKKTIILGIILAIAIIIVAATPYTFYLDANVSNRMLSDPAGMTYMEYFQDIADAYGITIDKVVASKTRIMHLYSNDFASLEDRQKLDFFAEFSNSEGSIYITDKSGAREIPSLMVIHSQGAEYEATIHSAYYGQSHRGGSSILEKNGKTVLTLASEGIGSFTNPDHSGERICRQCGGDGRTHDWNDEGVRCWVCGGDGYVEKKD